MRRMGKLGANSGLDPRSPVMPRLQDESSQRASSEHERQQENTDVPIVHGTFVRGIVFQSGQWKQVFHRLGRTPQGYVVVRALDSAPAFYEVTPGPVINRPWTDREIWFYSESDCTVDLWVF